MEYQTRNHLSQTNLSIMLKLNSENQVAHRYKQLGHRLTIKVPKESLCTKKYYETHIRMLKIPPPTISLICGESPNPFNINFANTAHTNK